MLDNPESGMFNLESEEELEVLLSEGERHVRAGGLPPALCIRINPDVSAGGHKHILHRPPSP